MAMTAEEVSKKLDDLEALLEETKKRADEAEVRATAAEGELLVSKLDEEDREAFNALPADDQTTFKVGTDEQREALLEKGRKSISKSVEVPEEVQKRLDDISKKLEAAEARANAAEVIAKKAEDDRRLTELSKRAEDEFAGLPGTPVEKGLILKSIEDKLTKDEAEAVYKLFKAGNECLRGQMKEVGKSASTSDGADVWSKIEKKGQVRAEERKISLAKAITQVIEENPELYTEYLNSK